MIAEFLERLTKRKSEVARTAAGEWQALVCRIADEHESDPDATLTTLDRLNKTPDDLAKAVGLLSQRRAWAATVAAGIAAEVEHPKITKKIDAELAAFKLVEEAHEAAVWPMTRAKAAAAQSMAEAAEARRRLCETATDPLRLAAVEQADSQLTELRRERAEHDRELRGKEDRLTELSRQEDSDLAGHVDRLKSEIEAMRAQVHSFNARAEKLNSESEVARAMLLLPAAI